MAETANIVWADGPPSDPYQPDKSRIRAWGTWIESFLSAIGINSGSVFTTRSSLYSNLSPSANSMAWVLGDPVAAYNGIYQKQGASGIGSWVRIGDLPFSFIVASDLGAGTPNAIQATSSIPVSASALVVANVFEANTGSPVTISFNGGPNLTIKTNTGNDIVPGGLVAGMQIFGFVSGSTFRLISDQVSGAIVAAAEAAADEASAYADFIRNNWLVAGPFTGTGAAADYLLPINPGSVNNMFPIVGGVVQMVSDGAYSLTTSGGNFYININVPSGVVFEVRIGNKVDIGTPSDGTVTAAKLAAGAVTATKIVDDAVTYAKMQNVSATARLLGRVTAGAGDTEEVTPAQLRDTFFPAGSIVDSLLVQQATSAFGITALIPIDNTIPQIGEGTSILSTNFTPKKTTNKLRATIIITGANSGAGAWVGALFAAGVANALAADIQSTPAAGNVGTMKIVHEWTPGVTTAVALAVRAGVATPYSGQTLTINPAYFGGVNHCSLLIEEIAA